jgi:hypothetical protein
VDQLIVNSINLATKPNQQPQTPTKLTPKFKALAEECGFVFWGNEPHGPGAGNIDWSCDYTSEFEHYSRELVLWAITTYQNQLQENNPRAVKNTLDQFFFQQ